MSRTFKNYNPRKSANSGMYRTVRHAQSMRVLTVRDQELMELGIYPVGSKQIKPDRDHWVNAVYYNTRKKD
jgi:hypothetical protein